MGAGAVSGDETDAIIANLNARMVSALLMPPFQLGPEPLRCPVCGRTRMGCLQFYGRDQQHDEEIRSRLREQERKALSDDETAHASLTHHIDLTVMADSFVLGWKEAVMIELDRMRREMPYADTLVLRLECERRAP